MRETISAIVADSLDVKRRYFAGHADDLVRAALLIAATFEAGGRLPSTSFLPMLKW